MREVFRGIATMMGFSFRADRRRAVVLFVVAPVANAAFALGPWLIGRTTDAIVDQDRAEAYLAIGVLTGTAAVAMALVITSFLTRQALAEKVDLAIDQRLIELSAAVPTIEHHERPEYLDRLETLRTHRHELGHVVGGVVNNLQMLVNLSITAFLLVSVHPALAAIPLAALPSMWINVRTERHNLKVEDETAEDSRRALHLFDMGTTAAPGKELRIFGLAGEWKRRYHELWSSVERRRTAARRRSAILGSFGWSFFAVGYGAGMYLVVREAAAGRSSVGQVLMAMLLMGRLNGQVSAVAGIVNWLLNSLKTVSRFLWLSDYAAERTRPAADPAPVPERLTDGVRFEGVGFRYPDTDRDVLHGVDLHLPAGATVALVGENGAGKTTLIKLLCGFYAPTTGRITVDGVPLDRIPTESWRQRMSAGFQDFARFEIQVGHVVGIGQMDRLDDEDAVWRALERGGGADVPSKLPDGLATELGSAFGGHDLSGGQWQKLALGRAMMRDRPLLLVLDEPTANLDAETEHGLFQRYAQAARAAAAESGAITVLVSHRFSTVRMADLIVVVDGGRVTEIGTHAELMSSPALYAELYELQARSYR